MKIVALCLLLLLSCTSSGQLTRNYFFDEKLEISDSSALVLIVRNPQTQFAAELNHRIYQDTSFIREIKENWFFEYDEEEGYSQHRCGYDLFFYNLAGAKYIYLGELNSNCGISEVGCTNLDVLLQSGRPLKVDTLTRIPIGAYKTDLFDENLIEAYYENSHEWENCRTRKYPELYYDGMIRVQIHLDTNFTLTENAEKYLLKFTNDLTGINWNITDGSLSTIDRLDIKSFEEGMEPSAIEMQVYMKSWQFSNFQDQDIQRVSFNIETGKNLLLFYRN
ncbi:MAG: hypothetical protein ACI865_003255 [Flavobacteriaceae bacterium]|jgi:hypothetical protein